MKGKRIRGAYKKGKDRRLQILRAARKCLIDSGYHNFSMRKVADSAGIRIGNLQYYFPTKAELVQAMLDGVIEEYLEVWAEIRSRGTPEEQFLAIIEDVVLDLNTRQTTVFFPEVWSLSNHETFVTRAMDAMYETYRGVLVEVILEMNPSLSPVQAHHLALFISASIEGHTMFIGYRKPWRKETGSILAMAQQSFIWLIRNGDIPGG
jgi:AcrR family transcriptional regulator